MSEQTIAPIRWDPPVWLSEVHESWLAPLTLRRQLVEQGMSDRALRSAVRAGALAKPRYGAYADGPTYLALDPLGRHAMASRAVLLQADRPISLSHSSALPWFGGPDYGLDLSVVHVLRHDGRAGRREAGVCQHRGAIAEGDLIEMHGMSLTNPCRSGLEFTMIADLRAAVVQLSHLLHTELTTKDELWARYETMTFWPRTLNTEIALRLADGRLESVFEVLFWLLCYRHALPMPEPQYVVEDPAGVQVARLDFAWPQLRKYAECDGKVKYEKYLRPGERASDVVLREKERDKLVKRLTGMEGERFVWADLAHETRTVARLRAFLAG